MQHKDSRREASIDATMEPYEAKTKELRVPAPRRALER